jgi:uncharacterized protein YkwD
MIDFNRLIIIILLTVLIAGCTQNYGIDVGGPPIRTGQIVCPDGSIVNDSSKCVETVVEIKHITYSESTLGQVETEIFNIVNEKRYENNIKNLLWNDDIAKLARKKSKEMANKDYFNHESPTGEVFSDILKKNEFFYLIAAEDIALFENITTEQDLLGSAEDVVELWLSSPAHRAPILDNDELYSDAGVGAYCKDNVCYFTIEFVSLEAEAEVSLKNNYGTFIYIYDPNFPFDFNVSVFLEVNSTKRTDTYIVEDEDQFDLFMRGYPINYIKKYEHNDYFNTTITVQKGNGILIYSDPFWVHSNADILVKIRYLSSG